MTPFDGDLDAARTGIKTASEKPERARRARIGWPDVLRVLQGDETRSYAIGRYRAGGFGPDDFARSRPAREAMADALTYAEDRLELQGWRRDPERAAMREVRRALELELWP